VRVAVLTQYFPNSAAPWGGHSAYQTLRELAKKVELHVFSPVLTYPRMLTPKTRGAAVDSAWRPAEVPVTYVEWPLLPLVSRPLNGFVITRQLLPHVRSFRPDILLNYIVYPDGYATVRVGRKLGVPVVLTAIGSDLNRIPDPLVGLLTRTALRNADLVTTVSADLGKTARRMGARNVQAILNGCDTSVFYPQDRAAARAALGIDVDVEAVVYVGRLDVRKGLVELIEAVGTLRAARPKLRCYIVGDGPDRPLLLEAMKRVDTGDSIELVPACFTADVARWMAAADLVTLPSYREGCPNVIIEALAAGRPVVATNVGGIPELMDDSCGRLIPAQDAPALAAALDDVLGRSWNAVEIAAKHNRSWADVADDLYRVLNGLRQTRAATSAGSSGF
jgi:teichuronic acid biosynthesis glycosyltransferase TuaC